MADFVSQLSRSPFAAIGVLVVSMCTVNLAAKAFKKIVKSLNSACSVFMQYIVPAIALTAFLLFKYPHLLTTLTFLEMIVIVAGAHTLLTFINNAECYLAKNTAAIADATVDFFRKLERVLIPKVRPEPKKVHPLASKSASKSASALIAVRCHGKTARGLGPRCNNSTTNKSGFCHQHEDQA